MNTVCLYVGIALSVLAIIVEIQLHFVRKYDSSFCRRIIVFFIALAELGVVVTFFGDEDWFWVYPMFIVIGFEAVLVSVYVIARSRAVFWDLMYKNRVHPALSMWWNLAILFIAAAFVTGFALYSIPYIMEICVVVSWICFLHFLNKLRIADPSGPAARMFIFILSLVISTILISAAFWYVYYSILDGDLSNIYNVSETVEIAFIAGCVGVLAVWKFQLISCLGYSTCDLIGCTKYKDEFAADTVPLHQIQYVEGAGNP
jgi:hypothetical protein